MNGHDIPKALRPTLAAAMLSVPTALGAQVRPQPPFGPVPESDRRTAFANALPRGEKEKDSLDEALETALTAAIVADVASTIHALGRGRIETNPILGKKPSPLKVAALGGVLPIAINELLVEKVLPKGVRKPLRAVLGLYELSAAANNIGLIDRPSIWQLLGRD